MSDTESIEHYLRWKHDPVWEKFCGMIPPGLQYLLSARVCDTCLSEKRLVTIGPHTNGQEDNTEAFLETRAYVLRRDFPHEQRSYLSIDSDYTLFTFTEPVYSPGKVGKVRRDVTYVD